MTFVYCAVCLIAGYLVCKFAGPKIDTKAGIIVHRGVEYVRAKL